LAIHFFRAQVQFFAFIISDEKKEGFFTKKKKKVQFKIKGRPSLLGPLAALLIGPDSMYASYMAHRLQMSFAGPLWAHLRSG
jgi:hypothetical protein